MTISAISSSGASFVSTFQQDRQAFNQLTNALQSGDLTAAQNAYNTLASSPMAQGNSPFAQAIQQIGQDLQSGDASSLADAQKVMSSLQQARGHHHHHHGGGGEFPDNEFIERQRHQPKRSGQRRRYRRREQHWPNRRVGFRQQDRHQSVTRE